MQSDERCAAYGWREPHELSELYELYKHDVHSTRSMRNVHEWHEGHACKHAQHARMQSGPAGTRCRYAAQPTAGKAGERGAHLAIKLLEMSHEHEPG